MRLVVGLQEERVDLAHDKLGDWLYEPWDLRAVSEICKCWSETQWRLQKDIRY